MKGEELELTTEQTRKLNEKRALGKMTKSFIESPFFKDHLLPAIKNEQNTAIRQAQGNITNHANVAYSLGYERGLQDFLDTLQDLARDAEITELPEDQSPVSEQ